MTYEETLHYLYTSIPVFQNAGPSAYKPGLGTSIALDDHLGNPHKAYKTIHVAGTNGKGSVSHLLAAILRQSEFLTERVFNTYRCESDLMRYIKRLELRDICLLYTSPSPRD